ncbi:hypothetical protein MLOOGBEN_25030 [Bacillus sp. EB106-08-02-XG196]|uniref:hypothetical protein n=1 Tax=Bacillus sp. EB106-08-02-XG196 TaxID=2737049 RepID=UPI0015C4E075|nr:hypothetical protein [Bacillus sp. EB106-08-02-XG196]NWQ43972.1 hypothetical protein [Bacillus sp. EB106-08-02-XG196]
MVDQQQQWEKERLELVSEITRLNETIEKYRQFAETVRTAKTMDFSIYEEVPSHDWLSIDREDYDEIMESLSNLDVWRPWSTEILRRHNR